MLTGGHVGRLLIMTRAAGLRLTLEIQGRGRRGGRQDIVGAVAILTGGGPGLPRFDSQTVNARVVTHGGPRMAARAIHRQCRAVVVGMPGPQIRMTTEARVGVVDGSRQPGGIHIQRNGPTGGVGDDQRLIRMTFQTILIGHRFDGCGPHRQRQG